MAMLYIPLVPAYLNLIGRGAGALTPSVAATSAFPLTALYDGQSEEIFQFGSLTTDPYVKKDINIIVNPTFATSAANWVVISSHNVYQLVNVQSSELLQIKVVTTNTATVTIQNTYSGNYLNSSGAWQAGSTTCISVNGTATLSFAIEAIRAMKGLMSAPLKITVSDYTLFTSAILVPAVNFCSIHGHNLGPVSPLFQYSDDDSSYTTGATMVVDQPAFYSYLGAALYHRYWRVSLTGTNYEAIYLGELIVGNALAIDPAPMWNWKENESWPAHLHQNDAGLSNVVVMTSKPMRGLNLVFMPTNLVSGVPADDPARLTFIRREIWERCRGGAYPIVVVVRSTRNDVLLGQLRQTLAVDQLIPAAQSLPMEVVPSPMPLVGVVNGFPPD